MPRYDEVTQRAGSLRAMTGLTEPEFTALLPHFERALAAYLQNRTIDGQPRTSRRYSAYDNCPLPTIADKLLFILTYLKQNPIQEVQGQLFGMSQSNANTVDSRAASRVESGLSRPRTAASPNSCRVCRDVRDARGGRKLHHSPFWHDGTERPIHRPTDPEEQQEYYSGKKKCHTLKNLLVIN